MNPLRKMLHQEIAHALGCTTDDDYQKKKTAVLQYLRRVHPKHFQPEDGRKRAAEKMAEMEGITVEEKMEDLALTGFLLQRLFQAIKKEDAFAALAESGVPTKDLPLLEKILSEIYGLPKPDGNS